MIGHDTARSQLERELPPAVLLHGPQSVGKWTLARHLADHHRVAPIDRWEVPYGMTIDTVRLVSAYAARAPHGAFKLIVARLDDSDRRALNALLKTLEEPPPRVKFLLTCTGRVMPTIASRCQVFELGLLTTAELEDLYRSGGMPARKAQRAAVYARGHASRGFDAEQADRHRSQVISLAKAISTGDRELFSAVFSAWDVRSNDLLSQFITECLTHRWSTFSEDDTFGLHHDRTRLWRMASAVTRLPAARPRLGVRAALEPFLSR
jgi:replication-associated recombination protein RarA